uniref:DDE Tnp4 domain-containing protein n=4 Tax=Leptobrachium leishanense TaxID=445787 RepID=A0A8C5MRY0_9ANUR
MVAFSKMDAVQVFLFAALGYLYLKKKRQRRTWVHPINTARHTHGHFVTLYRPLRERDPVKFFNYLRMSIHTFDELLMKVREPLTKRDTNMRAAIPPEEMLVLTLRYLASGCSLKDLHYNFRIGRSTAGEIVRKVCQTIWETMKDQCLPTPTGETWLAIAAGFWERANYPNCLGAVDGKHVRIVKPLHSGSLYQNYKHYFSIGLLAVADANYNFVYVDVGSYGKDSDSTLFRNSTLWNEIEGGNLNIPRPAPLPGSDVSVPYAFVGDEAFGLSTHLLRPYSGTHLTVKKRVFNYRLSRARRYVECSFGILSNKWRIFHRPLDVNVDFCVDIVKCCCILHNYVRARDGVNFEDTLTVTGLDEYANDDIIPVNRHTNRFRDALSNYFTSNAGQVPWQMDII